MKKSLKFVFGLLDSVHLLKITELLYKFRNNVLLLEDTYHIFTPCATFYKLTLRDSCPVTCDSLVLFPEERKKKKKNLSFSSSFNH